MASLGVLALGTYTNIASTTKTGTDPVLEVIASANDGSYVSDATNTTHTGLANFTLGDVPTDLLSVDTVSIQLRYNAAAGLTNTWDTLTARIFKSDGVTPLTNLATIASSITTTTATNSSVVACTGVDTAASQADWNAAIVQIGWGITKIKAGDTVQKRVSAGEVTGTYTVIPANPNPNVNDVVSVTEFSDLRLARLVIDANDVVIVSESATVAISLSRLEIASGDYVIIQEGQINQPKIVVWDTVTVAESYSIGGFLAIDVFDTVLIQDSPAVTPAVLTFVVSVFDNVLVQEGQQDLNTVNISVIDIVTLTEGVDLGMSRLNIAVSDLVTVIDAPSVFTGGPLGVIAFDTIVTQEQVQMNLTIYINAFDAIQVIDGAWNMDLFEAISVTEDITVKLARLVINVNDIVTLSESLTVTGTALNADIFDELLVTDSVALLLTSIPPAVSDLVTVTESATVSVSSIGLTITVFDTVTVADVLEAQTSPIQINEFTQVLVQDVPLIMTSILLINAFDAVTVSDVPDIRLLPMFAEVFDTVGVTERVAVRIGKGGRKKHDLTVVGAGE